jgi:hypothetical protein
MSHGSIAQIYDLGRAEDGSYFLAMEYVHGRSLADLIALVRERGQRLPPDLALQVIERAAEGLSYAHHLTDSQGQPLNIIHRDISPHNILVSSQGEVKLIDFGIAKSNLNVVKTDTGKIKGKTFYMSPEQSAAQRRTAAPTFLPGHRPLRVSGGREPLRRENPLLALQAIQLTDPPRRRSATPTSPRRSRRPEALAKQATSASRRPTTCVMRSRGCVRTCPVAGAARRLPDADVRRPAGHESVNFVSTPSLAGGSRAAPAPAVDAAAARCARWRSRRWTGRAFGLERTATRRRRACPAGAALGDDDGESPTVRRQRSPDQARPIPSGEGDPLTSPPS